MSKYQDHVAKWRNCRRCDLCKRRHRVVIARGTVPCQVLFLGEAPGASENVIGQPFVGPAGHLLNKIIAKSIPTDIPYLITNLVGCIPKEDRADKSLEPPDYAIEACKAKVVELVKISKPKLIVTVGKLARKWLPIILKDHYKLGKDYKTVDIIHPAAILRMDVSQVGLAIQRSIVTLRDAVEDLG